MKTSNGLGWEDLVKEIELVISEDPEYTNGGTYWKSIEGYLKFIKKNNSLRLGLSIEKDTIGKGFSMHFCDDTYIAEDFLIHIDAQELIDDIKEYNVYGDRSYKKEDLAPYIKMFEDMANQLKELNFIENKEKDTTQ